MKKQELIEKVEKMRGIANNPDFYLKMQEKLKNNAFAQDVNNHALTQILWEAKEQVIDDVIALLDSEQECAHEWTNIYEYEEVCRKCGEINKPNPQPIEKLSMAAVKTEPNWLQDLIE